MLFLTASLASWLVADECLFVAFQVDAYPRDFVGRVALKCRVCNLELQESDIGIFAFSGYILHNSCRKIFKGEIDLLQHYLEKYESITTIEKKSLKINDYADLQVQCGYETNQITSLIILIIKAIESTHMNEYTIITTPQKETHEYHSRHQQTLDFTPEHQPTNLDIRVDYKAKTFKLMKQLAESEVLNKKYSTQIRHLQKEVESYQQCILKLQEALGVNSYEQLFKRVTELNSLKVDEWASLIQEYKKIINAQQYKFIRQQQQLKILQMKAKRLEHQNKQPNISYQVRASEETSKLKMQLDDKDKEVSQLNNELSSLSQQLAILKDEYKQVLIEKQKYKDQYVDLHQKYNLQIQHFEQMEKHVEERLLEVQRQMNFYREQRESHLEKIELLKKEIDYTQNNNYFSFGGVKHTDTQTEFQDDGPEYNYQCLEISIKTLLEENAKLKNTLLILYTKKPDEQLPKQIELQLKILLNMHESSSKPKAEEYEIEKYFQSQKKREGIEESIPQKIQQVRQEQEQEKDQKAQIYGDNVSQKVEAVCLDNELNQKQMDEPSEATEPTDANAQPYQ